MDIIGVITEYNPFHNGHIYHINKIKELYPNSIIILALNGYFLERGEISIMTKEEKTKMALDYGINLVVEIPFIYGSNSADTFAECGVKILDSLGVNKIVFGSESNDVSLLTEIAKNQLNDNFNKLLKTELKSGTNYPTALSKALNTSVSSPNDLLGISYIKAIIKNNFNITAVTIKRTNDFHDKVSVETIVSASNIREKIKNNEDISKYTPVSNFVRINEDLLFNLLKVKILTDKDLSKYLTVDEGIEYKLKKEIINAVDIDDLVLKVKSKRYTYNRIRRMLIHILIGLTKKDKQNYTLNHIKILGFDKTGKDYLKTVKSDLIIQRKISDTDIAQKYELTASLIYDILTNSNTYKFETSNKPIIKTSA